MEGKNCFRTQWKQEPIYSGGNISTISIQSSKGSLNEDLQQNNDSKVSKEFLVMACGDTINVVDEITGIPVCSYTIPLEDLILCLDTITLREDEATSKIDNTTTDSKGKRSKKVKVEPEEANDTKVEPGMYIAVGTRQLQLYLLQVKRIPGKKNLEVTEVGDAEASETAELQNDGDDSKKALTSVEENVPDMYRIDVIMNWTAAQHAISSVYFSPSGLYLAAGSTDGSVKVWNAFHHHLTHNLNGPFTALVQTIYIDDSESFLVLGSFEGHVSVFDFKTKVLIASTRPHVHAVEAVSFNSERTHFVSIGRDRRLSILAFDARKKKLEETRAVVLKEHISAAVFEDDSSTLHVGSLDGIVATYAVSVTEQVQLKYRLPKPPASDLMDNEEEALVRSIVVKGKAKGGSDKCNTNEDFVVDDIKKAPSHLYVASAGFNISLVVPREGAKGSYSTESTLVGYLYQVLDVKTFPESSSFEYAIVTNSKDVRLFNNRGGCLSTEALQGHSDIVLTCAISPNGDFMATAGKDMEVRFWSCETWECAGRGIKGHSAEITSICFNSKPSDTYSLLFSVGADENLRLWDVNEVMSLWQTNTKKGTTTASPAVPMLEHRSGINVAHSGPIFALATAPNDQYVATGGKDKNVNIWNVTGKKLYREASLKGHKRGISALCFSPADRVLASASNDGSVRLWSLVSLTCIKTLQEDRTAILQLSFFNKGTQVVTGNAEGVLRVWAVATSESVWSGELHNEKVWALSVLEKEKETVFLSGSADGVLISTEDFTSEEVVRVREERTDTILKEQELSNAIRKKEFSKAFMLALHLNHPRHLRQVLTQWCGKDVNGCEKTLKTELLPSLNSDQLMLLLQFTREWITNSKHCGIANLVIYCFLASYHLKEIAKLPYAKDLVAPLLAYAQKHSERQRKLVDTLYYIDYLTRSLTPNALTSHSPLFALVSRKRSREEEEKEI